MRAERATEALQEEFSALLHRHQKIVFKVANSYARFADRADLAQEIAAQLWRAFPAYDSSRSFSTWMYRIALNVAISHLRGTSLRAAHSVPLDDRLRDSLEAPVRGGEEDENARALYGFINTLDAMHRALLLLYLEDHSYAEIAEVLGGLPRKAQRTQRGFFYLKKNKKYETKR